MLQWFPISETEAEVKSKSDGAVGSLKLKMKASRSRIIVTITIFELKYKCQVYMNYILAAGWGLGPSWTQVNTNTTYFILGLQTK